MNLRHNLHLLAQYCQSVPLRLLWLVAALLPSRRASSFGAALLGALGPLSRKHRHVRRNLAFVLPDAPDEDVERVARQVWRNFGSVLAEYPHLRSITAERCDIRVPAEVQALFDQGRPALFVSGHVGNWEIVPSFLATKCRGLLVVYSPDINPFVEASLQRRRQYPGVAFVDKDGALRQMLTAAQEGASLGLLPDLRVDSGTLLPLFDVEAPTTISPARIAQRVGYPLIPLHVERLPDGRFTVDFHPPLVARPGLQGKEAAIDVTRQFYALLEIWISERPGQWLCTKRRWPKHAVPRTQR